MICLLKNVACKLGAGRALALAALVGGVFGPGAVLAQVPLGAAADFAVLGASSVVNTGPSILTGNVGVAPGTAIVGFPPGVVAGGTLHAGDATATLAQSDAATAYAAALALQCDTPLAGDLSGLTLAPGVYCVATSASLSGNLTLDYQNDPNAVFVFQIGSTLITGSTSTVAAINTGGNTCASNVTWAVGSSATLGTASNLVGNIIANTSVTLTTNALVDGRVLAINGAVTLDTAYVTACTIPPPANVAPVVQLSSLQANAAVVGTARLLDSQLALVDPDSANLVSATVTITQGLVGTDVLSVLAPAGITASYDPLTGVLRLDGSAPLADYVTALRTVRFLAVADLNLPAGSVSTRSILVEVSDGVGASVSAPLALNVGPPPLPPAVTSIPTLSTWALIVMSTLLGLSAVVLRRQRRPWGR